MRLLNKVAVITGATGGIGSKITEKFLEEGSKILLIDLDEKKLSELKEKCSDKKRQIETLAIDVSEENEWKKVANKLDATFGEINILVNNAGISGVEGVLETTPTRWEAILNTNLKSVYLSMHQLLPKLIESGGGSIINISSIFALIGSVDLRQYLGHI